jgi:hypothetical protein
MGLLKSNIIYRSIGLDALLEEQTFRSCRTLRFGHDQKTRHVAKAIHSEI